jgi:hypothetical protein
LFCHILPFNERKADRQEKRSVEKKRERYVDPSEFPIHVTELAAHNETAKQTQ